MVNAKHFPQEATLVRARLDLVELTVKSMFASNTISARMVQAACGLVLQQWRVSVNPGTSLYYSVYHICTLQSCAGADCVYLITRFVGFYCQTKICDSNPCLNNGTCKADASNNLGYKCDCIDGFHGDQCEMDPCGPNPCKNGGSCSRFANQT